MRACTAISEIRDPLDWTPEKSALFVDACREMALYHRASCPELRFLYERRGFDPESIRSEADIERIPAVGVTAMKYFLLTSMDPAASVLRLTSSGTRGQKTQVLFDQCSLDRVQRMMDVYLEQEGIVSKAPANYLVFNYDPDQAGDLGTAYTEKNQLRFAPVNDVLFAIRKNGAVERGGSSGGDWEFRKNEVYDRLVRYEREGLPVRIFAMPAFLFEFLEDLRARGLRPLRFATGSWILTGGGWKAAEDKKVSREAFRGMCLEAFGIDPAYQRDAYGMAEHCAPYLECREHRLHVAAFNRVLIRDPLTLRRVPDGEGGLLELVTPFNAMMPTLAILTTDYGRIHPEACRCGFRSPTFEILGRAGLSKHKGCAITAAEIVKSRAGRAEGERAR